MRKALFIFVGSDRALLYLLRASGKSPQGKILEAGMVCNKKRILSFKSTFLLFFPRAIQTLKEGMSLPGLSVCIP